MKGWVFAAFTPLCFLGLARPVSAETARPSDAFVDSVGVNTHLGYGDTAYGKLGEVIEPRLRELGVRHLRDQMHAEQPWLMPIQQRLVAQGFRFMLISQIGMSPDLIKGWINALGPAAVSAVEGPNEYDLVGGEGWPLRLEQHTQALWSLVKGDPTFSKIMVAGPTLVDWKVDSYPALGDQSAFMDLGNFHWYYAGWPPTATGNDEKKLEIILDRYRPVTGDKPFIISECGYHNATVSPPFHWRAPEDVVAKYVLSMFLYHFDYGLLRSFSYEFIDQFAEPAVHEANFGLLGSDGRPKPAFTALKNLLQLLNDPGPAFVPEALDFELTGDTSDVQVVLLQKRTGDFFVALWSGKPILQPVDQVRLTPPAQQVELKLSTPSKSVQIVKPNQGVTWQDAALDAGVLKLALDAEVQLLRIVPTVSGLTPSEGDPSQGGGGAGGGIGGVGSGVGGVAPESGGSGVGGGNAALPPGAVASAPLPSTAPLAQGPQVNDAGGCGCRQVARGERQPLLLAVAVALGLASVWRRRHTREIA